MKSPTGSLKGPNVSGLVPPSACSNHAAAAATFGTVIPTWSIPSRPGTVVAFERSPFCFGDHRGFTLLLVRHPLRIADQLDVRPERGLEVVDRLTGRRPLGEGERPEELLDSLRHHVRDGRVDVGDVERDVVPRPVRVARVRPALIRCLVLEELDVRAVAEAKHRDLVDHRARVDAEQIVHQRPRRIGDRAERQRRRRSHHVLEPGNGLADVGNGQPDVVGADQAKLATTVAVPAGAARAERVKCCRGGSDGCALLQEISAVNPSIAHGATSLSTGPNGGTNPLMSAGSCRFAGIQTRLNRRARPTSRSAARSPSSTCEASDPSPRA